MKCQTDPDNPTRQTGSRLFNAPSRRWFHEPDNYVVLPIVQRELRRLDVGERFFACHGKNENLNLYLLDRVSKIVYEHGIGEASQILRIQGKTI
jgi:hypothetical protein